MVYNFFGDSINGMRFPEGESLDKGSPPGNWNYNIEIDLGMQFVGCKNGFLLLEMQLKMRIR